MSVVKITDNGKILFDVVSKIKNQKRQESKIQRHYDQQFEVKRVTFFDKKQHMKHIEDDLQMACVEWFGLQYPQLADMLHHSPNGGKRNAREAARFKKMGTRPGYPDLFLAIPIRKNIHSVEVWHGLYIEMKSPTGATTAKQKEMQKRLKNMDYCVTTCRSKEEFIATINNYLQATYKP